MMMARQTKLWDLPEPSPNSFARARERLSRTLEPHRSYCCWVDGPFGKVFLAKSEKGLCRVSFERTEQNLMEELEGLGWIPEMAPERIDDLRRQFDEYFSGKRRRFELRLAPAWGSDFQRRVLEEAARIPFGEVVSYSDIARRLGKPRACRAVGNALGRNPVAIVIPCHRVVSANGGIGGYTGGVRIKKVLMEIEGIRVKGD